MYTFDTFWVAMYSSSQKMFKMFDSDLDDVERIIAIFIEGEFIVEAHINEINKTQILLNDKIRRKIGQCFLTNEVSRK